TQSAVSWRTLSSGGGVAAWYHVADLVRGARAHEPQHEVQDEADGGELQDPQGEPEEAAEDAEENVERDERQRGKDRETENAPKHGRFPPWCPTVGPYGAI